jgi:hypothetical protein
MSNHKYGKLPPRHDVRNLKLSNYLKYDLVPPTSVSWQDKVLNNGGSFQMFANDSLGDCTCAAVGNMIINWTANAGQVVVLQNSDIIKAYSDVTGYNPSDPNSDQGANETDVLNYWRNFGVGGHQIGAYAEINQNDITRVQCSTAFLEGVYIGFSVPQSVEDNTNNIWDVGGNENIVAGHAVIVVGYDDTYLYIVSWGSVYKMTYPFWNKFVDEAYGLISQDEMIGGANAAGLNLSQLTTDLNIIKGQ